MEPLRNHPGWHPVVGSVTAREAQKPGPIDEGSNPSIPDPRRPVIEHPGLETGRQLDLGEMAEPLSARAGQVERVEDGFLGGRHALPIPFCRTSRPHRASTFWAIAARDYTWRLLASASVGQ